MTQAIHREQQKNYPRNTRNTLKFKSISILFSVLFRVFRGQISLSLAGLSDPGNSQGTTKKITHGIHGIHGNLNAFHPFFLTQGSYALAELVVWK